MSTSPSASGATPAAPVGAPEILPYEPAIHELNVDVSDSPYYSADMAPTGRAQRKWAMKDFAVLWISMAACIPTYTLASSLISEGMNWWEAILTIFLGNVVVLVPMILNAHAGTKYGIPFPVYCRASFGILGANVPALLRAFVACGWFGIQTWIGGDAIYTMLTVYFPQWVKLPTFSGVNAPQFVCFLAFWALNMVVVYRGIDSIRLLLNVKAPLLILLGLALLWWAYRQANGFGPMLTQSDAFGPGGAKAGLFWTTFVAGVTANVGFWSTLSLNIPDFSRYAYSQRDQVLGQMFGLPPTMALYSFIGVAVTSATIVIFGAAQWDPVKLLTSFRSPAVLIIAMLSLCVATLATNIAANVVSPANDFAHLWPKRISFRTGGFITGVIGILLQPWQLYNNPNSYLNKWLLGYSPLLGAVGAVLIADYFFIRRTRLDLPGLYRRSGGYWYAIGFNLRAIIALLLGIAPCVPGFLGTATPLRVPGFWMHLYNYAWFISFGVAFFVYVILMFMSPPRTATSEAGA